MSRETARALKSVASLNFEARMHNNVFRNPDTTWLGPSDPHCIFQASVSTSFDEEGDEDCTTCNLITCAIYGIQREKVRV